MINELSTSDRYEVIKGDRVYGWITRQTVRDGEGIERSFYIARARGMQMEKKRFDTLKEAETFVLSRGFATGR